MFDYHSLETGLAEGLSTCVPCNKDVNHVIITFVKTVLTSMLLSAVCQQPVIVMSVLLLLL